jgi:hypothetical protein
MSGGVGSVAIKPIAMGVSDSATDRWIFAGREFGVTSDRQLG